MPKEHYSTKQNSAIERLIRTKMLCENVRQRWSAHEVIEELKHRGHIDPGDGRTECGLLKKIQRMRNSLLKQTETVDQLLEHLPDVPKDPL